MKKPRIGFPMRGFSLKGDSGDEGEFGIGVADRLLARLRAIAQFLGADEGDVGDARETEHRAQMEARAKEKGVTLREPRQNGCDRMKAKGLIQ